jgi:hypothetical protein
MWNLEGKYVTGIYLGLFPVSGYVHLSRVMYGGRVSHHITLDEPIKVYGAVRETVILEHESVAYIYDNKDEQSITV